MILIVSGRYRRAEKIATEKGIEEWMWVASIATALRLMGRITDRRGTLPDSVLVDTQPIGW